MNICHTFSIPLCSGNYRTIFIRSGKFMNITNGICNMPCLWIRVEIPFAFGLTVRADFSSFSPYLIIYLDK